MVRITDNVDIPDREITYTFSTSSGPGGQNVNKVSTRVTLHFDVSVTESLTERQRGLVLSRLGTRITKGGILRVVSQKHRSQRANREAALERFVELLRGALREAKPRRPTSVPRSVHERRLEEKRRRSRLKRERARPTEPE